MRRRHRPHVAGEQAWSRRRLQAVLAAALAVLLVLSAGLVLGAYYALHPEARHPTLPTGAAGSGPGAKSPADALAAAPMRLVDPAAARPDALSERDPGVIVLPASTRPGPAGVATGYPHTPAGALAQLAAIDQAALQSASLAGVRAVIAAWAAPGGPTPTSWSGVAAMAELLTSAGVSTNSDGGLVLAATPVMGLIKGTVGADFVVPCVDFEVDATLAQTQRVAEADCQRMVWAQDRWLIGPGPEPAVPPSVWPDTDLAIAVGYRDLRHA